MANKYDHLFISGADPKVQEHRPYAAIGFLTGQNFEGCHNYHVFWVGDKPYGPYGNGEWGDIYHGPHVHKYPEVFMHLGTDPDNPMDLGADVEMFVGPERERHLITTSTMMYFPPNLPHSPWRILKVRRPFLIVTVNQSTRHTEKALMDSVTEEERKRMLFINAGYEDEGIESQFFWPEAAGKEGHYI